MKNVYINQEVKFNSIMNIIKITKLYLISNKGQYTENLFLLAIHNVLNDRTFYVNTFQVFWKINEEA